MKFGSAALVALVLLAPLTAQAQQRVELPPRDRPLNEKPADVWKVGKEEGDTWEMLSTVNSMAFDSHDNLYVLELGNKRVLEFDANGRFLRQIGKEGGGPGEFQFPLAIRIARDGSIVIYDAGRRGYSVFGPDGQYRKLITPAADVGSPRPDEIFASPQGGLVVRTMPRLNLQAGAPTDSVASPIVSLTLDETPAATRLYQFMMPPPTVRTAPGRGGATFSMVGFSRATFDVDPTWGVLPDGGLAVRQDDDWSIRITDASGSVQRLLTRPFAARNVTRRDQDDARDQQREQLRTSGGPTTTVVSGGRGSTVAFGGSSTGRTMTEAEIEEQVKQMTFADRIPAIRRITVDATGRIWVERNPGHVRDTSPIDLIASDGRYIGTVTGTAIPMAVSSTGLAAWVEKTDLDVEQVVVRRLPANWK